MSFEDIRWKIQSAHRERYLAKRAAYLEAVSWYCHSSHRRADTFQPFSAMDDYTLYNDCYPSAHFIIGFFKGTYILVHLYTYECMYLLMFLRV